MSFRPLMAGALLAVLSTPLFAADITVEDAYARAANTRAGAAFLVIHNAGDDADRLVDVRADVAMRVELHTHKDNGQGVMQMLHVPEGFEIPAGGDHVLQRGGDHVMFMGLQAPWEQGQLIPLTLVFEKAGEITVDVPVDLTR
ncbi:copper chaperone PCu(A)C [Mesobacterium pallidum]|uniref:copper chaperone PCu(A)C n=1 Tax=Mesobacterium pallidum TaxID=2872037 RepID=UPI001EE1FF21|nr:copper chaperone PCu(A)C [Mesobacterium pallidum]